MYNYISERLGCTKQNSVPQLNWAPVRSTLKMLTETGHILHYSILMSIYFLLLPGRSLMEYS